MTKFAVKFLAPLALAATTLAPQAMSAPFHDPIAIKKALPSSTETVRWRGGWGVGAGFLAGAVVAGAIARPYYYSPYYYGGPAYYPYPPGAYYPPQAYGPPPGAYGGPPAAYGGPPPGGAVQYCMQRFRSYDPNSGTYLGNDGARHPCP